MPFQYRDSEAPAAGSIAALMIRRGDIAARQAEQIGAANAHAAEVSGNAWAGAAGQIGNAVSGSIQQATDPKRKMEGLQYEEAKKHISEGDTIKGIIRQTPLVDLGGGVMGYDLPSLTKAVTDRGGDPSGLVAQVQPVNDALQQYHAGRVGVVTAGAKALQAAGNDPALADNFLTLLEKNHVATPEQVQQYRSFATTPENVGKLTALYAGPPKFATAAPGSGVLNESTGQLVPGQKVPDRPVAVRPGGSLVSPDSGAVVASVPQLPPQVNPETERHNKELERIAGLTAGRAEAAQKETARHNLATEGIERNKATQAQGDKTDLTPEGLDAAAMMFAKTGQLPALGMGDKTTRKAIINRAAVMVPGLDVASAKADFEANKKSLDNVTGTLDTLESFSKAANKNLDQFVELAQKLPDTGIPWANTPLRLLNDKMVGAEYMPAINAARAVATREIARITGDPKLKGVLSDAARHEVDELVPNDITLNQLKHVVPVLRKDMDNVHVSLGEQKSAIQGRLKLGSPTSDTKPKSDPLGLFGPKTP